jgi:predicted deacylase
MQTRHHLLPGSPPGTQREIVSHHYGVPGSDRKVYIQASLHADELPGMLVAHHLRERLRHLEAEGRLAGEVVVVPVANPIGLAQSVLRTNAGRFDLASGANFNRHYPALAEAVAARVAQRLGPDGDANAKVIRAALVEAIAELPAPTELAGQRKILLGLAADAEVVLDLHCDGEALVHLYTATPLWPAAEPLARCLGAEATLLAQASGDDPFDEACSQTWSQLAARFAGRFPVPLACLSVTVELRGMADVSHELADADAAALVAFLAHRGIVAGTAPALAPLRRAATRLDAVDVLVAPVAGVVVFRRALGEWVAAGDVVVDVVDPLSGQVHAVASRTDGLLFAREAQRHASAGRGLAKIAGSVTVRSGKLTSE